MEQQLKIFATPKGAEVRVVTIDGEPWFVAKDIAERTGCTWNGTSRIEHVPEKWRRVTSVVTLRGDTQDMALLSEQGMYFFLARSDKPHALQFQEWIAGEILPSIRKTGAYGVQKELSRKELFRMGLEAEEAREAAEHARDIAQAELIAARPAIQAQEQLGAAVGAIGIREAAKRIGWAPKAFVDKLIEIKYLFREGRKLQAYATLMNAESGYFTMRTGTTPIVTGEHAGKDHEFGQLMVTPAGLAKITEKLGAYITPPKKPRKSRAKKKVQDET